MHVLVTEAAVTVEDVEDLKRLAVVVGPQVADTAVHPRLLEAGLTVADTEHPEPDHQWLSIDALRAAGAARAAAADWPGQFDGMIAYATGKGWTNPDGSLVAAHIERSS